VSFGGGPTAGHIAVDVNDRGNPWDSGDQIVIDGSSQADTIVATDSQITGTGSQTVTYHRPDPDKNVLSLNINGNDGVDHITVQSTRDVVPVKVDGGAGNDVIDIGGGTLNDIVGLARPGIQVPYGVGPVVVVGGAGLDTLIVDNHSDPTTGLDGTLVSWLEQRQTAPDGTDVGGVGGLGMTMYADFNRSSLALTGAGPGRIEFEDVEALTVLLGSGDTTFTVGGDSLRPQLPKARQEKVLFFDQSPTTMTSIVGGTGNDTFQIVSTAQVDRTQLDASGDLIAVNTLVQGVTNTKSEKQHIDLRDGKVDGTDTFTLSYHGSTTPSMPFNVDATTLQTRVRTLVGNAGIVVTGGSGVFDVVFPNTMGDVDQLLATFTGKLVTTTNHQQGVQGSVDEQQDVHISGTTDGNGYFTVKYKFQETTALPLNVTLAAFQSAVRQAFTFAGDTIANLNVTSIADGFRIDFGNVLGDVDQVVVQVVPLLLDGGAGNGTDRFRVSSIFEDTFFYGGGGSDSANVNLNALTLAPFIPSDVVGHVVITPQPNEDGDTVERVDILNATGGTFRLSFKGEFTTPIAWDAPGQGDCITIKSSPTPFCSVQKALENLSTIGDQNVEVTKSDIDGSYRIKFVKALAGVAQPLLSSDVVITHTTVGNGTTNDVQTVTIAAGVTGSFSIDYTYDVRPLGLATDPNAIGTLSAGTYYYVVTAITGAGQTLPSAEVHTTIGNNGAVKLAWGEVPNAVSYRIWRSTAPGSYTGYLTSTLANVFDDGIVALTAGTLPASTAVTAMQTTVPIDVDAAPGAVQAALEILPSIGAGNVTVTGSPRNYTIAFAGALGHHAVALLGGATSSLRSNGINAVVTMDGGGGADTYNVNLIGGRTSSLINVLDSGVPGDGGDALTVTGTDFPDIFLLRAATSDNGLAFVALINGPTPLTPAATDPVERINYNKNLEAIVVNGGNGDDQFYVDDTRASITVNGDEGNDFFQIGQLFRSRRTPALAGVAPEDVFATIETTQGWLSNGISKPMTINGGVGNDNFIVFHNLDTLSLFGDAGNDTFLVQAFALAGSQEDHRALTDLSGGGGADLIQYAVNAPVNIDGGDGFDTVVIIGTEFNDDFVITSTGVFGAGLHVSFVNIEALTVDGGAGDDRFFVQSTGPTFTTEIDGGLGSDFISVEGPTPVNGVISNDLLGHSGIITHSVESTDGTYSGISVVGVSANVADDDTPGIVVTQSGGGSMVVQSSDGTYNLSNHTADNFSVVLTRAPGLNTQVVVNIQPPQGLALLLAGVPDTDITDEVQVVSLSLVSSGTFTLHTSFGSTAALPWDAPAAVVQAALQTLAGAGNVLVKQTGTTYTVTFQGGRANTNVDEMTAELGGQPRGGTGTIRVTTSVNGGFSVGNAHQLVFDNSNWWLPQSVVFVVDVHAETIGTNAYFQNSADVRCSNQVPPLPPSPPAPNCTALITGSVQSGKSVDMNSHTVGDEYAVLTASTPVFADYVPGGAAALPEGLRGAQLKISGNDPEAEGQLRLVLGSYLTHLHLGGATAGKFTIAFGSYGTTAQLDWNATPAQVKAALEALLGDNTVDVTSASGGYDVALRGTLFLSDAAHLVVNNVSLNGGAPSADIDGYTIKVNSAWSVEPKTGAQFEVSLYGGVKVPAVQVAVYSAQKALVVVAETDGSTSVNQDGASPTADEVDHIAVRLSQKPVAPYADTEVKLGDHNAGLVAYYVGGVQVTSLHFTELGGGGTYKWDEFVDVEVRAVDDGVIRGIHRADLSATASHYFSYLTTIVIGDNHWAGVRVIESGGSTNVIEETGITSGYQSDGSDGLPTKLPAFDSYTVSLTKAPSASVKITATAQPTRTSQTGGIVSFAQQLDVSLDGIVWADHVDLTFTTLDWRTPKTVYVRAHQDTRVDGQDTQVFAPQLEQLNTIQGPLFVNGGEGANRAGLLEREPVMLPGERNQTPAMGHVVSSTPGTLDNSVAATVTIEHSQLATIGLSIDAGTSNTVQTISINAISGTYKLRYGAGTTDALAFDAPAVTVQDALRALLQAVTPGADLTVARNGSELQVRFFNMGSDTPLAIAQDTVFNAAHLGPQTPADLKGITFLVTAGPAKNKTRIVTGGIVQGSNWVLTLDKAWFSPFTNDASTPDGTSTYTLLTTNPNLLVDEATQANLLYLYDNDNPARYNDPNYHRGPENPFGAGQIFYDNSPWGPADEDGTIHPLNQFRLTGFGMGGTRCIGGPEDPVNGGCTGPVGANEPGGVTFQKITDLELNLGDGANHVTVDTFTNVPATVRAPKTTINTRGGDDVVDVKGITGHTFVNLGAGSDTLNVRNDAQRLTDLAGLLTVSGDSPQANIVNYANGSPAQGTAVDPVDAIQILTVDATSGSYDITYAPRPLNVTASQNRLATGSLAAGNYYYVVTAVTALGETLPSPEAYATVTANGRVDLAWYRVPGATSYRIYRGTTPSGENVLIATGLTGTSYLDTGSSIGAGSAPTVGVVQKTTVGSADDAATIQTKLGNLSLIGTGNVEVTKGGSTYRIHFKGAAGGTAIALLGTDPTSLLNGAGAIDTVNVYDTARTADGSGLLTSTSLTGLSLAAANEIQQLVVDATSGQYTLTYAFPVMPTDLRATQSSGGDLTAGTHYYKVTAITASGESLASNIASAVTADNGAVNLTWTGIAQATGYRIYRGATPQLDSVVFIELVGVATTFHDIGGGAAGTIPTASAVLDHETTVALDWNAPASDAARPLLPTATAGSGGALGAGTWFYRVAAITAAGESDASSEVSATLVVPGSVVLTWNPVAGATGYRVYRGGSAGHETVYFTAVGTTFTDNGSGSAVAGTPLTRAVQSALESLPALGDGNVVVTRNDDVYTIRFQGTLSDTPVQELVATRLPSLQKRVEHLGGGVDTFDGTASVHTRADLSATPIQVNQIQILTVDASGGSFRLTFHVNGVTYRTDPIPYNAGAEQLRQIVQNAIAAGETNDPFLRAYLVDKLDVTVDRYPGGYLSQNIYALHFQGELRRESLGQGVDTLTVDSSLLNGSAWVTARMDGIQYYGVEALNIATGSGADVFDVQGTTRGSNGFTGVAVTNVALNAGDDRVYISSNADLDGLGGDYWRSFDFLTGNLDDVRGALNIDLGAGRHRLFMSDEASTHNDNWSITDTQAGTDIAINRIGATPITYKTSGDLYDGVVYWSGSGNDTISIDGTKPNGTQRTTTVLNTGLGNDTITVSLSTSDGFFVLETSGGAATGDPIAHQLPALASDDDVIDASASTLPLVIIGGFGNDLIKGGQANDIVLGDLGIVQYTTGPAADDSLLAQFGFGGRGDVIDAQAPARGTPFVDPRWVYSRDLTSGQVGAGNDTIYGNGGEDILVGGTGNDAIDGGLGDDLIFGDAVQLQRRDVRPGITGDITSLRFQTLGGTQIYSTADATLGAALNDGTAQTWRDGNGVYAPDWAEYLILNLYHSFGIQATTGTAQIYGNDFIAGGAADDMIFGQLGNDVIQGDGSIDLVHGGALSCATGTVGAASWTFPSLVGACRDTNNELQIHPSSDSLATDGSDYIEGNGGSDVIFGNQGQDDIVGGNSDLYTLTGDCSVATEAAGSCRRPDAPNMVFGGSGGNDIAIDDLGATGASSEAHDADTIVANNGDIIRLVGTAHTPQTGFLGFGYDTSAFEFGGSERIVARSVRLLDYTLGGTDYAGTTGPVYAGDIGAGAADAFAQARGTEIHGGQGDDVVYGGAGNDVLYGDGQNDVLIGGYGNDWISGGNGDDGVLGDDGRIFISRIGIAEPLFGIAIDTNINDLISTPGTMQQAVINTLGAVRFTAVLTPDNLDPVHTNVPNTSTPHPNYANDIIYGGLANDALHGGAGDDAMSGAEAPSVGSYVNRYDSNGALLAAHIRSDWAHPFNPGNPLGYSPTLTYQAQYNPNDPFREIQISGDNWFLNFSSAAGPLDTIWATGTSYAAVHTDGNDALFGDLGNDWLVGGTGRDTMYGGWGNDYLNGDDVLDTNGVTNLGTDTNPSYEDLAFGGAGRDVLVANTGGDRLIDWIGEFDSYLTEFAPFGMATVSRTVQPQLPEFLYALSLSDGADPFIAQHYGSDPTRNGEPFGELGVVLQHDAAWQDQRGKPRDPQAGNTPGVQRDVLRTSGNKTLNSPDTDPPVAGAGAAAVAPAAPVVEMAPFVSYGDQMLAPLVISGAVGAVVQYRLTDGMHTVTGSGTTRGDGKLSILVDVSTLSDGTVTASATLTLGGLTGAAASTTATKKTVIPGSVGLALAGYVGIAGRAGSPVTLSGAPGNYIVYEIDGPTAGIIDDGYLDATGQLTIWVNFTGYADGIYYVSATQFDNAGNMSEVQIAVPRLTLDTVLPTGTALASTTLTNNPTIGVSVSFTDDRSGVNLIRVSVNGGATWSAWQAYAASLTVTLPSPDGTYSVIVQVTDKSGNIATATQTVTLDRTGPTLAPTLNAPNNGTFYDLGTRITLSWSASDLNGVSSTIGSIEGQTITASGGTIDVDVLTAGTHTVTITSIDRAGNVTTKTITFTIHATPEGILKALNDAIARGWVTAAYGSYLVTQIQQVTKAEPNHTNMKTKLIQFINSVQSGTAAQITPAFKSLLLNWANDLYVRL
jgi:Ca2+-binding RTX toxin-like protein